MRFLIKCIYCLSAALCTLLWVYGKNFNACMLVYYVVIQKLKTTKIKKKPKKIVCLLSFFLGTKKNCLHTPLHMHTHQYCSRVEHDLMGFFPDIYVRFFPELVGAANSKFFSNLK